MTRVEARRTRSPSLPSLAVVALSLSLGVGCERTSYYASSGGTGEPSGSGPTGPSSGPGGGGGGATAASRAELIAAVATCTTSLYDEFRVAAAELDAASATAAQSGDPAAVEASRAAWRKAMGVWQQAELFQFGPAGPTTTPGGQDLRAYVYSWPLVSRCLVEQTIVNQQYASDTFAVTGLINVRGLAAAEYLLFYPGTDNACSPESSINSTGSWAALGASGLAARKRAYAAVLAKDLASRGASLHGLWAGTFEAYLAKPGTGESPYESEQQALNAISDALFYMEESVKDLKLAAPLGLIDCEASVCPELLESQYARASKDHVRNNLLGFRRIVVGCGADGEGVGFDDLLDYIGATDVATAMRDRTQAALSAVDAIEEPTLAEALAADKASVVALHAAVKATTDVLKTDFVSVLDLELPKTVEGDND